MDEKQLAVIGEREGFFAGVALQVAELGVTNDNGMSFYMEDEDALEAELSNEALADYVGERIRLFGFQVTKNPALFVKGELREGFVTVLKVATEDGEIHYLSTISETILAKVIRLHKSMRFTTAGIHCLVAESKSTNGNTFFDLVSAKAAPKPKKSRK